MSYKIRNRTKNLSNYWEKRIFFLCWLAYAIAYIGRVNLSIAIPQIEESLPIGKTSLGLVGSVYFWVYAFGQLINGRLGDKFSCRNYVFAGLFFSALFNIFFAFSTSLYVMTILWAFNGYFQSMLWGPLMKTINQWFPNEQKSKIAIYMSTTYIPGFLLAWGGLGQLSSYTGWAGMFWIPGIVMFTYAIIWYAFARDNPGEAGLEGSGACTGALESKHGGNKLEEINKLEDDGCNDVNKDVIKLEDLNDSDDINTLEVANKPKEAAKKDASFLKLISSPGIYLVAIAGIPLGFIREGIILWSPTMLYETFRLDLQSVMGASLLIPLFNFFGIIVTRLLISKFYKKEARLVFIFFICGTLACILLYLLGSVGIIINLTLLAVCSLSLYGATSIITSVIPLRYSMTSSMAGFLDFSIYLGAGLTGIITGLLSSKAGWNLVTATWIIAGAVGGLCVYIAGKTEKNNIYEIQETCAANNTSGG